MVMSMVNGLKEQSLQEMKINQELAGYNEQNNNKKKYKDKNARLRTVVSRAYPISFRRSLLYLHKPYHLSADEFLSRLSGITAVGRWVVAGLDYNYFAWNWQ
jgi:hypothetical protein